MSQVTGFPGSGIRLSKFVLILTGEGDPNTSTTPDIISAGVGSIFLRSDAPDSNHAIYIFAGGVWAAK